MFQNMTVEQIISVELGINPHDICIIGTQTHHMDLTVEVIYEHSTSEIGRRTSNTLMMTPKQSYFIKPSAPPERYGKSSFDYFNKVHKCMAESLGWKKWGSGAIMEPKPKPKSPLDELRSEVDEWLKDALT